LGEKITRKITSIHIHSHPIRIRFTSNIYPIHIQFTSKYPGSCIRIQQGGGGKGIMILYGHARPDPGMVSGRVIVTVDAWSHWMEAAVYTHSIRGSAPGGGWGGPTPYSAIVIVCGVVQRMCAHSAIAAPHTSARVEGCARGDCGLPGPPREIPACWIARGGRSCS